MSSRELDSMPSRPSRVSSRVGIAREVVEEDEVEDGVVVGEEIEEVEVGEGEGVAEEGEEIEPSGLERIEL